ncbi:hypothetical protein GCM10025867_03430 [Frondihabitans sucicola]|uniref:phosphoribosylaminoimidazolesuccinocarboxamide synthase n=1 Tax=Frondihabitans sucicola TaxID=1268041 RepID=A0ABM8GI90_9MICO|nr:hypothetical protein GCM10025867_03430 [Frondihabitans sucicola]
MSAPALPGWSHVYSGKVRDLYVPEGFTGLGDAPAVLVVASDRVSAFDFVLEPGITDKGALLTALSTWWFGELHDVANHLLDPALSPRPCRRRSAIGPCS